MGHEEAEPGFRAVSQMLRRRDPSRLLSWASAACADDKHWRYADVISCNDYSGWYYGRLQQIPYIWAHYANWRQENWPEKAFLVSEVGAGAVPFDQLGPYSAKHSGFEESLLR